MGSEMCIRDSRGTDIIVNGGESLGTIDEPSRTGNAAVYIASGTMLSVVEVDLQSLSQDSTSGYAIPSGGGNDGIHIKDLLLI